MNRRSRFLRVAVLGAALAVTASACGGDGSVLGGSTEPTATSEAAPTTAASSTSEAATSTIAPTTVPEATTTSTTAAPTTTTSTTPTTTTTTAPPPALRFLPDGLDVVDFGASPPATLRAVRDALGMNATFDSGWVPAWGDYGACPGTEHRHVEFDGLVVAFTDAGLFAPAGTRQFFSWSYNGSPAGIATGLTVGSTVADIQAAYPAVEIGYDDMWFGDYFRVTYPDSRGLWGTLTGPGAADTIDFFMGGIGCGE